MVWYHHTNSCHALLKLSFVGKNSTGEVVLSDILVKVVHTIKHMASVGPFPKRISTRYLHVYDHHWSIIMTHDKIDIAIAWKKPDKFRPAERFTNPISFGIPTIGYRGFATFRYYKRAGPFLCDTSYCIVSRIEGILNGSKCVCHVKRGGSA